MPEKRDQDDQILLDELESGGGAPAPSSGVANAVQGEIVQPEKTGAPIEGLDADEDPTGGAGGP
ncbi:MAG: hypothetical protein JO165_04195 [Candidatus Eremiobacteraeota bacterium]|nr:hypothetical protein [Candidatus Eremiobacteraeota bacterium]